MLQIEGDNPYLLISYIYHLYMGLLSGGQILSKKRSIFGSSQKKGGPGNATTEFGPELPIGTLKKKLREATNRVAEDLDEETKKAILVNSSLYVSLCLSLCMFIFLLSLFPSFFLLRFFLSYVCLSLFILFLCLSIFFLKFFNKM